MSELNEEKTPKWVETLSKAFNAPAYKMIRTLTFALRGEDSERNDALWRFDSPADITVAYTPKSETKYKVAIGREPVGVWIVKLAYIGIHGRDLVAETRAAIEKLKLLKEELARAAEASGIEHSFGAGSVQVKNPNGAWYRVQLRSPVGFDEHHWMNDRSFDLFDTAEEAIADAAVSEVPDDGILLEARRDWISDLSKDLGVDPIFRDGDRAWWLVDGRHVSVSRSDNSGFLALVSESARSGYGTVFSLEGSNLAEQLHAAVEKSEGLVSEINAAIQRFERNGTIVAKASSSRYTLKRGLNKVDVGIIGTIKLDEHDWRVQSWDQYGNLVLNERFDSAEQACERADAALDEEAQGLFEASPSTLKGVQSLIDAALAKTGFTSIDSLSSYERAFKSRGHSYLVTLFESGKIMSLALYDSYSTHRVSMRMYMQVAELGDADELSDQMIAYTELVHEVGKVMDQAQDMLPGMRRSSYGIIRDGLEGGGELELAMTIDKFEIVVRAYDNTSEDSSKVFDFDEWRDAVAWVQEHRKTFGQVNEARKPKHVLEIERALGVKGNDIDRSLWSFIVGDDMVMVHNGHQPDSGMIMTYRLTVKQDYNIDMRFPDLDRAGDRAAAFLDKCRRVARELEKAIADNHVPRNVGMMSCFSEIPGAGDTADFGMDENTFTLEEEHWYARLDADRVTTKFFATADEAAKEYMRMLAMIDVDPEADVEDPDFMEARSMPSWAEELKKTYPGARWLPDSGQLVVDHLGHPYRVSKYVANMHLHNAGHRFTVHMGHYTTIVVRTVDQVTDGIEKLIVLAIEFERARKALDPKGFKAMTDFTRVVVIDKEDEMYTAVGELQMHETTLDHHEWVVYPWSGDGKRAFDSAAEMIAYLQEVIDARSAGEPLFEAKTPDWATKLSESMGAKITSSVRVNANFPERRRITMWNFKVDSAEFSVGREEKTGTYKYLMANDRVRGESSSVHGWVMQLVGRDLEHEVRAGIDKLKALRDELQECEDMVGDKEWFMTNYGAVRIGDFAMVYLDMSTATLDNHAWTVMFSTAQRLSRHGAFDTAREAVAYALEAGWPGDRLTEAAAKWVTDMTSRYGKPDGKTWKVRGTKVTVGLRDDDPADTDYPFFALVHANSEFTPFKLRSGGSLPDMVESAVEVTAAIDKSMTSLIKGFKRRKGGKVSRYSTSSMAYQDAELLFDINVGGKNNSYIAFDGYIWQLEAYKLGEADVWDCIGELDFDTGEEAFEAARKFLAGEDVGLRKEGEAFESRATRAVLLGAEHAGVGAERHVLSESPETGWRRYRPSRESARTLALSEARARKPLACIDEVSAELGPPTYSPTGITVSWQLEKGGVLMASTGVGPDLTVSVGCFRGSAAVPKDNTYTVDLRFDEDDRTASKIIGLASLWEACAEAFDRARADNPEWSKDGIGFLIKREAHHGVPMYVRLRFVNGTLDDPKLFVYVGSNSKLIDTVDMEGAMSVQRAIDLAEEAASLTAGERLFEARVNRESTVLAATSVVAEALKAELILEPSKKHEIVLGKVSVLVAPDGSKVSAHVGKVYTDVQNTYMATPPRDLDTVGELADYVQAFCESAVASYDQLLRAKAELERATGTAWWSDAWAMSSRIDGVQRELDAWCQDFQPRYKAWRQITVLKDSDDIDDCVQAIIDDMAPQLNESEVRDEVGAVLKQVAGDMGGQFVVVGATDTDGYIGMVKLRDGRMVTVYEARPAAYGSLTLKFLTPETVPHCAGEAFAMTVKPRSVAEDLPGMLASYFEFASGCVMVMRSVFEALKPRGYKWSSPHMVSKTVDNVPEVWVTGRVDGFELRFSVYEAETEDRHDFFDADEAVAYLEEL